MKRLTTLAVALALFETISLAHAQSMKGMDMKGMDMTKGKDMMGKNEQGKSAEKKSKGKSHRGAGTVKKIDLAAGTVTIAHGPVADLKWPAMTMTFAVKDKALLGRLSQDKKVKFEFVQQGSDYVITSVK